MELRKSNRSQVKIKIAFIGISGSGKTYSSLLLGYGLCQDWNKIAVIDTENQSSDLYSHLGEYNVLSLTAPFSPERYIKAISTCEENDIEVIIIDSLSHSWEANGGVMDTHSKMTGNSFTNWAKLISRNQALIQKILNSNTHVIVTVRCKQDVVISERNGKQVPEKVGLKGIQKDGLEYDFSIVFEIDANHLVTCSKDRTQLFTNKQQFKIDQSIGQKISMWCGFSDFQTKHPSQSIESKISSISNLQELQQFYKDCPNGVDFLDLFNKQAEEIRKSQVSSPFNFLQNGR